MGDTASMGELLKIMAQLRDPVNGCPWDVEQTSASIAHYAVEEAYEVVDAIQHGTTDELKNELGDLLLQVVFHAQIAHEQQQFDFHNIVQALNDKLIRRHPHVFQTDVSISDDTVRYNWEAEKQRERQEKGQTGTLAGVARALPAILRAQKLQKRAAEVNFDWSDWQAVIPKIHEELDEVQQAGNAAEYYDEVGDLLFACVNLARHLDVDAEAALKASNEKFERRFARMEQLAAQRNQPLNHFDATEWEALWQEAKRDT